MRRLGDSKPFHRSRTQTFGRTYVKHAEETKPVPHTYIFARCAGEGAVVRTNPVSTIPASMTRCESGREC
jgi:hypothetical protein